MSYEQDFDNASEQWLRNHRYTADPQVLARIAVRVRENLEQLGGYISAASFGRAYLELTAEKKIQPFRGTVTDHVAAEVPARGSITRASPHSNKGAGIAKTRSSGSSMTCTPDSNYSNRLRRSRLVFR